MLSSWEIVGDQEEPHLAELLELGLREDGQHRAVAVQQAAVVERIALALRGAAGRMSSGR